MFKRILKVIGFVLLGFVVVIGGVLGFMAIRGDFKQKEIYPTALKFAYGNSQEAIDLSQPIELLFDVRSETESKKKIYSFTVMADPVDVNQLACTVEPNYPSLITFKEWVNNQWVDYKSNTFYINKPIFFQLNDVTENNVDDYYDGVLRFKVIDSSNMLNQTIAFEVDRAITSIAFKDTKSANNVITNGLFASDDRKYEGATVQLLEAVQGQDYPLEVITAPLKAIKPFESVEAKVTEIFYMEQGQPKMLVYDEENDKAVLEFYGNDGIEREDCSFIKYDKVNNRFVLNSANSGKYEFMLATYATYDIQNQIQTQAVEQGLSFVERLNLNDNVYKMLTKKVEIVVSGTDAQKIEFEGDVDSIGLNLLKDNTVLVNNPLDIENYNLGLTLTKANSGVEILGRYNELAFINNDIDNEDYSFIDSINWSFKRAKTTQTEDETIEIVTDTIGNVQYTDERIEISLYYKIVNGVKSAKAYISNIPNVDDGEYNATLTEAGGLYTLTINSTPNVSIQFNADSATNAGTGKFLTINSETFSNVKNISLGKITVGNSGVYYVNTLGAGKMVLDGLVKDSSTNYNFKFLRPYSADFGGGMYLAILGKKKDAELYELINDKFKTNIKHDGTNSVISIIPIDSDLVTEGIDGAVYEDIQIRAIIVNADGSCAHTESSRKIIVRKNVTNIQIPEKDVELAIKINQDDLDYSSTLDVAKLAKLADEEGSYNAIAMFVNKDVFMPVDNPTTIDGLYIVNAEGKYVPATGEKEEGIDYFMPKVKIVHDITITSGEQTFYLVGFMEEHSLGNITYYEFVNQVQANVKNNSTILYPVVLETEFVNGELQTVEEFVKHVIAYNKYVTDYNNNSDNTEKLNYYNIKHQFKGVSDKSITLSSSYAINTEGILTGSIAGDYFIDHDNVNEDKTEYSIIPGHKNDNFNLNWDGTKGNQIENATTQIVLTLNHGKADKFGYDLLNKVKVVAKRYDKDGNFISYVDEEYIKIDNGTILNNTVTYNFEVSGNYKLPEEQYIRFEWSYGGNKIAESQKLIILSRELKAYKVIGLDHVGIKEFDGANLNVIVGCANGDIDYKIEAVLTTTGVGGTEVITETTYPSVLFNLISNGGMIKPYPFYAEDAGFEISAMPSNISFDPSSKVITFANAGSGEFRIRNSQNNAIGLIFKTTVTIDEGFTFGIDDNTEDTDYEVECDKLSYTIEQAYMYKISSNPPLSQDLTNKLKISIDEKAFAISSNNDNYKVTQDANGNDQIVSKYNDDVFVTITKDDTNKTWTVTRHKPVGMNIKLNIDTVIGKRTLTINFKSLHTEDLYSGNKTTTIYAGTTFVIASTDSKTTQSLYQFNSSNGTYKIKGDYITDGPATASKSAKDENISEWRFKVEDVDSLIEDAAFEVWYASKEQGAEEECLFTIYLDVAPNKFIKDRVNDLYALDDYTNINYNLKNFAVYEYDTSATYYSYDPSNADEVTSGISYSAKTYKDYECTSVNGINIASVSGSTLTINNPVTEAGVYYVLVTVKSDDTIIGYIKFQVTTKSDVVSKDNDKVEDIVITSTGTVPLDGSGTKFTLAELQQMFNWSRDGKIYYYKATAWEADKIYKLENNGTYTLVGDDEPDDFDSANYYYRKAELTDVFWLSNEDSNLEIVYTYNNNTIEYTGDDQTITQVGNTLKYNGNSYIYQTTQYFGTTYAHIFETQGTETTYIALTIDQSGSKQLYNATFSAGKYVLSGDPTTYTGLSGITFKYNSFGTLNAETGFVGTVEFGADLVFDNEFDNEFDKALIVNDNKYTINVKPYIVNPTKQIVESGKDYTLYVYADTGASAGDLFYTVGNDNISAISFSWNASDSYVITEDKVNKKYSIRFNNNGNHYNVDIPVTVNYKNGTTYSYNVTFNVKHSISVNITYPYFVDNSKTDYKFTESITVLNKSMLADEPVQDIYTDYANWNKLSGNIPYDLALAGDTIKLTSDSMRDNFDRYSASGKAIGTIQLVAVNSSLAGVQNIGYYVTCNNGSITFDKALPVTGYMLFRVYAQGTGQMDANSQEIEYTGAYGYYLVRVVSDRAFTNVLYNGGRNNQTEAVVVNSKNIKLLSNTGDTAIDKPLIVQSALNINGELINDNYSNISLFMISSDNGAGGDVNFGTDKKPITYENGQYIPNNTILPLREDNTIQTIKVAVVVEYGSSIVHVSNIELILQPNIKVVINQDTNNDDVVNEKDYVVTAKTAKDEDKYIYETRIDYDRSSEFKTVPVGNFFKVTDWYDEDEGETSTKTYTCGTVTFIDKNDNMPHSDNVSYGDIDSNGTRELIVDGQEIGTISTEGLKLTKAVSEEVNFYLQLTYSEGDSVNVYLHVIINPFNIDDTVTSAEVGRYDATVQGKFNNNFDVTELFKGYKGEYKYKKTGDSDFGNEISAATTTDIQFTPTEKEYPTTLTIELTDVAPKITWEVAITVKPNIEPVRDAENNGSDANYLAQLECVGGVTKVGSELTVGLSQNSIEIKQNSSTNPYLTINVGSTGYTKVEFTLTDVQGNALLDDDGKALNYFVGADPRAEDIDPTTPYSKTFEYSSQSPTKTLQFVHSASDTPLRLHIKVLKSTTNSGGSEVKTYYEDEFDVYIKLPKTYELTSAYRVDGATFETRVEGKSLTLSTTGADVDSHFLGTDRNGIDKINGEVNANKVSGVHGSRIGYKVVNTDGVLGNVAYGYDNLVMLGLLDNANPNKLIYVQDTPNGKETIEGKVDFVSTNSRFNLYLTNKLGVDLTYAFQVFSAEADFGKFTLNSDLVTYKDTNGNITISAKYSDLPGLELGYLNYGPNYQFDDVDTIGQLDGLVADVNVSGSTGSGALEFGYEASAGRGYIRVIDWPDTANQVYTWTLKVITMNGVSATYTLTVANTVITYGYGTLYETAYAGGEIGKLSEDLPDRVKGSPRLSITVNGRPYTGGELDTMLDYLGAYKGHTGYQGREYDYEKGITSGAIYYDDDNKVIKSRSVNTTTNVTMIFNVKVDGSIVGVVEYKIRLLNNIAIECSNGTYGAHPNINQLDVYLGTDRGNDNYTITSGTTTSSGTTTINLLDTNTANNFYIKLYRYSYQNGVAVASDLDLTPTDFSQHLRFTITNVKLDKGNNKEVDNNVISFGEDAGYNQDGTLVIKGNPSGSFVLIVSSTTVSGYYISIPVYLHKYDQTVAAYNNQLNTGFSGSGTKSGEQINLFETTSSGTSNSGDAAFVVTRIGYQNKGTAANVKHSTKVTPLTKYDDKGDVEGTTDDNIDLACEMKVFDSTTSLADIKNNSWDNSTPITLRDSSEVNYLASVTTVAPQVNAAVAYQIVAYRLKVTFNNDTEDGTDYYYAFYKVVSGQKIEVNDYYKNNGKVITFNEAPTNTADSKKTWSKVDTSDQLIIMGADGMYALNKSSSLYLNSANYTCEIMVTKDNGNSVTKDPITVSLSQSDEGAIIGTITGENLFTTEAEIKLTIKVKDDADVYTFTLVNDNDNDNDNDKPQTQDGLKDTGGKYKYFDIDGNPIISLSYAGEWYKDPTKAGKIGDKNIDLSSGKYYLKEGDAYRRITSKDVLLEDTWTLKASDSVEANQSVRLDKFFLQSEIGNQDYYDTKIIGIMKYGDTNGLIESSTNITGQEDSDKITISSGNTILEGFIEEKTDEDNNTKPTGTPIAITPVVKLLNGKYMLCKVEYKGSSGDGSTICDVKAWHYVLVGETDTAMSLKLTQDYINLTIDDSVMKDGDGELTSNATIDLSKYVTVYKYNPNPSDNKTYFESGTLESISLKYKNNSDFYVDIPNTGLSVGSATLKYDSETNKITLENVHKLTSNQSVYIEITAGGVSRKIELYFNIIINAKKDVYDSTSGMFKYNQDVVDAIDANNGNDIEASGKLKSTLLELINYNGENITTVYAQKFSITVKNDVANGYLTITYKYTYTSNTSYIRTFKMAAGIAANSLDDGYLASNADLTTAMEGKDSLPIVQTDSTLSALFTELWDLVTLDHDDDSISGKTITVKVVKSGTVVTGYELTYSYTHTSGTGTSAIKTTYSRTFKMYAGITAKSDSLVEGTTNLKSVASLTTAMEGKDSLTLEEKVNESAAPAVAAQETGTETSTGTDTTLSALSTALWNLVTPDVTPDNGSKTITVKVVKSGSVVIGYELTYSYTHTNADSVKTTYSRTFMMAAGITANSNSLVEGTSNLKSVASLTTEMERKDSLTIVQTTEGTGDLNGLSTTLWGLVTTDVTPDDGSKTIIVKVVKSGSAVTGYELTYSYTHTSGTGTSAIKTTYSRTFMMNLASDNESAI